MIPDFSAVLLAGGKSSRMRRDKAFIEINGVPLWQRQLQTLEQLAPNEIFLAGSARPEWNGARCTIITDAMEDSGPLGGLVAGLRHCSDQFLLVLAVDLPHMTSSYLHALLEICGSGKGAVPVTDRFEPLAAVYPVAALGLAESLLKSGRYSLQDFARSCLTEGLIIEHPVCPAETTLFLNINTPANLIALEQ